MSPRSIVLSFDKVETGCDKRLGKAQYHIIDNAHKILWRAPPTP
jgi:hypothetical protein